MVSVNKKSQSSGCLQWFRPPVAAGRMRQSGRGVLMLVPLYCGDRTCAWDCGQLPAPLPRRLSSDTAPCRLEAANGYIKAAKMPLRRDNAFLKEQPALQCWQLQGLFSEYFFFLFFFDELQIILCPFNHLKWVDNNIIYFSTQYVLLYWRSLPFTLPLALWLIDVIVLNSGYFSLTHPPLCSLSCSLSRSLQFIVFHSHHDVSSTDVKPLVSQSLPTGKFFPATVAPSMFSELCCCCCFSLYISRVYA